MCKFNKSLYKNRISMMFEYFILKNIYPLTFKVDLQEITRNSFIHTTTTGIFSLECFINLFFICVQIHLIKRRNGLDFIEIRS